MGAFTEIKESRIDEELRRMAKEDPREYAERAVKTRYDLEQKRIYAELLDKLVDGYRDGFPEYPPKDEWDEEGYTFHTCPESGMRWCEDKYGNEIEDETPEGLSKKAQAERETVEDFYIRGK